MRTWTSCFAAAIAAALIAFLAEAGGALAWERPHSDGANSGFADVATIAAQRPRTVPSIGTFAPGSGPVTAADGTVYLGNEEGQLIALQADGTEKWRAAITPGFSIVASPVVGSDGSIYAVGTRTVKNSQVSPPLVRYDSSLYKFTPAGQLSWQTRFPNGFDGPLATAAPNIWKIPGDADVVMVPADYPNRLTGGYDTNLVAFSSLGAVLHNINVKTMVQQVTGSSDMPLWCATPFTILSCLLGSDFNPSGDNYIEDPAQRLPEDLRLPRPGAAIARWGSTIEPFILVSNQHQDFVGYSFPGGQFRELLRVHDESRFLTTTPVLQPDGHTLIAATDWDGKGKVVFLGPSGVTWQPINGIVSLAPATRLTDGRMAVVESNRRLTILNGKAVERQVPLPGQSVVAAAASRNHLFVSTAGSFLTYDPATWQVLAEISWVGGGTVTPVIGPQGHVYGMASNVLFVFPPPTPTSVGPLVANPGVGSVNTDPGQPAATQSRQRFDAPTTPAGQRLFACEGLEDGDCGKSASKSVALAFCEGNGFSKVEKFDTEKRKGAAARLDNQLCPDSKCKVFDEITCGN